MAIPSYAFVIVIYEYVPSAEAQMMGQERYNKLVI